MFDDPDNERRVNELEVDITELSDEIESLKILLTETRKELLIQQELMVALAQSIGLVSKGERFEVETKGKQVILNHIPNENRKTA